MAPFRWFFYRNFFFFLFYMNRYPEMIQIEEGWRVWFGVSVEGRVSRGCQWFDIKMTPNNFLNERSYAAHSEMYL
jgi:hypothetical protein